MGCENVVSFRVQPRVEADPQADQSATLRVEFKDGSPPLVGLDAAEFVLRRIRSRSSELSEMLLAEAVEEHE